MNKKVHFEINNKKNNIIGIFLLLILFNLCESQSYASTIYPNSERIMQVILQKKITLNIQDKSAKYILTEIQRLSGIEFAIENEAATSLSKLSINVKDVTVEQALNALFAKTEYRYQLIDDIVTVLKRAPKEAKKSDEKVTISGRVIDKATKSPIAGATVLVQNTPTGAITDNNGAFSFLANKNDVIEISYTGKQPIFYNKLATNFSKIVIEMEDDAMAVDEVVVTGLLMRKKSGFAGTANVITKAELQKVSTGNIFTTISTLDAGFKINENNLEGSNPNSLPDFTIRGKGSFQNGSTAPIFIMDGFEVSSQKVFDMDMNRIESITLLKDASATILYGSRASNGVIVIETTAPKPGKLTVTYDFKPTIGIVDLTGYNLMNSSEKLEFERLTDRYKENNYTEQNMALDDYNKRLHNVKSGVDTYWLSQPVRNAFSHAHSLNVQGGDNAVRYSLDASLNPTNGVMKGSSRDRMSLGFTIVYRIKDKITISNRIEYSHTTATESPFGVFSTYSAMNPYEKINDENGELIPRLSDGAANPIFDAGLPSRNGSKLQDFNEQFSLDWNINNSFRLRGQISILKGNGKDNIYTSPFSSKYIEKDKYIEITERGELSESFYDNMKVASNVTINYNKIIGKHVIYSGAGIEVQTANSTSSGYSVTGFADDSYSDPAFALQYKKNTKAISDESKTRSIGFFANVNYIYDNRFFADVSFRYDGSSQFGSNNRFAPFWAAGGGWNLHNEKFINPNKFFDIFTLKYSYGVTGNQEFSAYQARTTYKFITDRPYYNSIGATLMGYGNPNLKWQSQHQSNIGLDLAFFKNRFRVNASYYNKRTTGMLTAITVAPSLGILGNSFISNVGEIQNKGFDVNANAVLIRKPQNDLEWAAFVQVTNNKNKLVKISNELKNINDKNNLETKKPLSVYEEGESMTALKAVRSLGIDPTTGKELFLTREGIPTYTWDPRDKVLCGDTEPMFYGNIGTNLYYKGWNLNVVLRYRLGADYYNETLSNRVEGADPLLNADKRALNDRWKNPGDNALYRNIKDYKQSYLSTRFIQKENTFEATTMSLSYEFKAEQLKKLRLNTLRLSFYANDLIRMSSIKNERGLSYPFQRSFVFGLNVSF